MQHIPVVINWISKIMEGKMLCSLSTLHVQRPSHEVRILLLVSLSEAVKILEQQNSGITSTDWQCTFADTACVKLLSTEVALPLPLVSGVADKLTEVESLVIIIVGS